MSLVPTTCSTRKKQGTRELLCVPSPCLPLLWHFSFKAAGVHMHTHTAPALNNAWAVGRQAGRGRCSSFCLVLHTSTRVRQQGAGVPVLSFALHTTYIWLSLLALIFQTGR